MAEVKLILTYNVKQHRFDDYYRFMTEEFLPATEKLGLALSESWRTDYGPYPTWLYVFTTDTPAHLLKILHQDAWDSIETKLGEFITEYQRRISHGRLGFQFI